MDSKSSNALPAFLTGGSDMGALIRSIDWAKTVLGPVQTWPQSLRTTVSILLNSKFPMFLFWGPELICFYNDAYRPSLGKDGKHPTAMGQPAEKVWPEIWSIIKPLIDQVMGGGEATWSEDQLIPIYRNGRLEDVYWTFSYSPVSDEIGEVGGVLVTCMETTQTVVLQQEQQKLLLLVENSQDCMAISDPKNRMLHVNKAGRELLGIDADKDITTLWGKDFYPPEELTRIENSVIPTLDQVGRWSGEILFRHFKTGETIPCQVDYVNIKDPVTGQLTSRGTMVRDLRPEMNARRELGQKNEELQRLIQEFTFVTDFMPQLVWSNRPDGYHDFYNKRWYDYTGMTFDDTKAEGWNGVLHPDDQARALKIWQHSLATGEPYEIEYRFRRYDGTYRWFLGRALPLRDASGNIIKWFGTCTDIDDRRKVADKLEYLVQARTQELSNANQELTRKNHELEQFAYIASHDLQEPLRKIQNFADLLVNDSSDKELDAIYLNKIVSSAQRMSALIKAVLNYSRLSGGTVDFVDIDLNTVIQSVLGDFELVIKQKGAEVSVAPLPIVRGDLVQVNQLFANLLSNSLKFSEQSPIINLSATNEIPEAVLLHEDLDPSCRYVHITVKDNGIGFDQKYADRVFSIFQRLSNSRSVDGTGIGLALCKKIIENHRGCIWAESELGEGATFHICLPVR